MKDQPGNIVVVMTREDLRALVEEAAEAAVRRVVEPSAQQWIDVTAAAKHAGVSTRTIRRWIEAGLPATHLGRDYRMRLQDIDAWLAQHQTSGKLKAVG